MPCAEGVLIVQLVAGAERFDDVHIADQLARSGSKAMTGKPGPRPTFFSRAMSAAPNSPGSVAKRFQPQKSI